MFSSIRKNLRTIKTGVIDQRQASIRRLKELYREGGIREVYRGVRDYYTYNVADNTYHESRSDNEERWEFIESHLEPDYDTLVDIGCADGYFSKCAADRGLTVYGLEGNQNRVERAKELCEEYNEVKIEQKYLSPDNITDTPSSGVVLFLTVHHHWIRQYGWDDAAEMFRYICNQTELVFYEPPGNKIISRDGSESPLNPKDSIDYYSDEINQILGDQVTIIESRIFSYNDSARADPIFVLDTSQYDR